MYFFYDVIICYLDWLNIDYFFLMYVNLYYEI